MACGIWNISLSCQNVEKQPIEIARKNVTDIECNRVPKGAELGVRLNKKDSLTRYGNSHVKDKTS